MKMGATLDVTGCYRYRLWREWDQSRPRLGFVMLNPSRADAEVDDPTIRRCIHFAQSWQYGSLEVVNLFAYRTASPGDLRQVHDPVGTENDRYLAELEYRVERVILAWGNGGSLGDRGQAALALFSQSTRLYCLGLTKHGQPRHPLYLGSDTQPQYLRAVIAGRCGV